MVSVTVEDYCRHDLDDNILLSEFLYFRLSCRNGTEARDRIAYIAFFSFSVFNFDSRICTCGMGFLAIDKYGIFHRILSSSVLAGEHSFWHESPFKGGIFAQMQEYNLPGILDIHIHDHIPPDDDCTPPDNRHIRFHPAQGEIFLHVSLGQVIYRNHRQGGKER